MHKFLKINLFVRNENITFDIIPLNTRVFRIVGKILFEKKTCLWPGRLRLGRKLDLVMVEPVLRLGRVLGHTLVKIDDNA